MTHHFSIEETHGKTPSQEGISTSVIAQRSIVEFNEAVDKCVAAV